MRTLHLKPGREKRIKSGHLWAFAGEIAEDISGFKAGDSVVLCESRGEILGRGYINPHSLIAVRLLTRGRETWEDGLFHRRIAGAVQYRQQMCPGWEACRVVYSESDGLPGLIVDRYMDHLAVQSLTAGIESRLDEIVAALMEVVRPASILLKGESPFRALEGLAQEDRALYGDPPAMVVFREEEATFTARPVEGQKTGFYIDQRANRELILPLVKGKRVLDLYSYTGAWGIRALLNGAREAVMVDSSAKAVGWGTEDAALNGVSKSAVFVQGDAGEFLAEMAGRGERFDLVVVDPPSLIRSRATAAQGIGAYRAIIRGAMRVTAEGGILASCSCSHLLTRDKHLDLAGEAAVREGRRIRLLAAGGHPADHPILPGHPETEYLKCWILRVD